MGDLPASRTPRESGADEETPFSGLRSWLKGLKRNKGNESARDAIEELIEEREEDEQPINEHERRLIGNVLHLRDATASDLMVPRADIVAINAKATLTDVNAVICAAHHSRYPVFRGTLDDVVGIVHIKDVLLTLAAGETFSLNRIVRRVLFVAPSIRVLDLLLEMRLKRSHMALVVDEYGGIDGLITIEDLIEEIVGEIEDEHDKEIDPDFIEKEDETIEADARAPLEDLERRTGSLLEERDREDIDTVGGLVSFLVGRVPGRGELIAHPSGVEFEIIDADPRRVKRIRVRNLPKRSNQAF